MVEEGASTVLHHMRSEANATTGADPAIGDGVGRMASVDGTEVGAIGLRLIR